MPVLEVNLSSEEGMVLIRVSFFGRGVGFTPLWRLRLIESDHKKVSYKKIGRR
jgi:hypothetical protein